MAGFLLGLGVLLLGASLGIVRPILSPIRKSKSISAGVEMGFFRTRIWGYWMKILLFASALSQNGRSDHKFTVGR